MLEGRTIAVVVPAHNEVELVRGMLEGIPRFVDHIVLVDDASTDGTPIAARECSRDFELVTHISNLGVGAAIATGCRRAHALGVDFTVVMAADGQMHIEDLPVLLAPLAAAEADAVKGNRLDWPRARDAMPWHRWLGNHVFSFLTRRALGTSTRDSQCGYIAMGRRALSAVDWNGLWKGYGYPNDLLCQLSLQALRVQEVPVRPVYGNEKSGIRLRHVAWVIPFVIARAWLRRRRQGAIEAPWPTSTSSTATRTESAPSRSSATLSRDKAL